MNVDDREFHKMELLMNYFAKLFGEVIFLRVEKLKRDDDFSYRYYIEDREGIEGVMEIRWDIFIKIVKMLLVHNPKYYNQFMREFEQ